MPAPSRPVPTRKSQRLDVPFQERTPVTTTAQAIIRNQLPQLQLSIPMATTPTKTLVHKDNIVRGITATLAVLGALLAVANEVKDVPSLAPISHWFGAVIGLAVAFKNICIVAYEALTGKKWENA